MKNLERTVSFPVSTRVLLFMVYVDIMEDERLNEGFLVELFKCLFLFFLGWF
jgi:hypothetical protein